MLRWWRAGLAIAAGLTASKSPLAGQTEGTLGLGASLVEYDGFLSSGAAVLTPGLRFDTRRLSLGGQASWTVFESGRSVLQGTAAAAWLAHAKGPIRFELSGSSGISRYADQSAAGHVLGGARLHAFGQTSGGWLGLTLGQSFGASTGVPVEGVLAGWTVFDRFALVGSMTGTTRGSLRQVDFLTALRWTGSRVTLEARGGARPWATDEDDELEDFTGLWGEVNAVIRLSGTTALTLSGGRYPSDPVRRVLGAHYLSAGLQLRTFSRPARGVPGFVTGILRGRTIPEATGARLEIEGTDTGHVVRIHAPGARSVEIMADFTDWTPVRLAEQRPGIFEVRLPIAAGAHRINLRIDGGGWIVPAGVRVETNEFGGSVGIVLVP